MSTRILLADDHGLFREGMRNLLHSHPGLVVVGEAEDGATAVRLAADLLPDLVLMDVGLPVVNGINATAGIRAKHADIRVIALSVHADFQFVEAMLDAGATGYVLKKAAFRDLSTAIEMVMGGEIYLSPGLNGVSAVEYGNGSAGTIPSARVVASTSSGKSRVEFALEESEAKEVLVLGSFGNWEARPGSLRRDARGVWRTTMWLHSGEHEYRFLVDGEWRNAPDAELVHNQFCSYNCLLRVE